MKGASPALLSVNKLFLTNHFTLGSVDNTKTYNKKGRIVILIEFR
jgi:hypothetical protein